MNQIRMKIIEKPEDGTATVFIKPNNTDKVPFITGSGGVQFICGNCKHIILSKVSFAQVNKMVFKCPNCGNFNQC